MINVNVNKFFLNIVSPPSLSRIWQSLTTIKCSMIIILCIFISIVYKIFFLKQNQNEFRHTKTLIYYKGLHTNW